MSAFQTIFPQGILMLNIIHDFSTNFKKETKNQQIIYNEIVQYVHFIYFRLGYGMEINSANITKRKDGRFMGKFIVGYGDGGKAQYQYVYGKTYDEAEKKVLIGREVASRFLSGRYITVGKAYEEWLNAVVNRVKESTLANYKAKFEKHILPEFGDVPCADLSAGRINEFLNKKFADGLSASYARDIFTVFKSMLKYAQEEYGLADIREYP